MIPLALIESGEKVEIIDFVKKGKSLFNHLRDIGIFAGKIVEVVSNQGHGPLLLRIDEARIAISRGMAMQIMVRRLQ
jgi:ferrous iron transport protein A